MKKIFTILAFAVLHGAAFSQAVYWDGGTNTSNWADPQNWSTNTLPTPSDSVVLNHSLVSGNYTVVLPNSLVHVKCLSIYPSSPGDSIFVNVPWANGVAPNLRVSGIGYSALRIGNRGRFNNEANTTSDIFVIDDLFAHGLLLDTGGYFYQGSRSRDTTLLRKLTARYNSVFEFDSPASGTTNMIFPLNSQVGSITFYHVIFSGKKAGTKAYGGTLANNWDLIVNGDLTVRDGAAFGLVRGALNQVRYIRIKGNIRAINTTFTTWIDNTAPIALGWYNSFEGTAPQSIDANIVLLDSTVINNAAGINVHKRFELKTGIFAVKPKLHLLNGVVSTGTAGSVVISLNTPGSLTGHKTRLDSAVTSPSYINGVLKRAIAANGVFEFPVGTANHYELAAITTSSLNGTDSLTVKFFTNNIGAIPAPLTEGINSYELPVNGGYWSIVPKTQPSSGTFTTSLYETGFSNGAAPYTIMNRVNNAAPWALQAMANSYKQKPGLIVATRSGYTNFSEAAIASSFQSDFSIRYVNYANGQVSTQDTIKTSFVIKNHGPLALNTGDTVYVSARINGMYLGLNLMGNKTPIVLTQTLGVNDSLVHNPGYLLGPQTLPFYAPATSLSVCLVVWGKGVEAVDFAPAFPGDMNAVNNIACMTYTPPAKTDFSIRYLNYVNGQISAFDTIKPVFIVKNHGPHALATGDTIYVSARINGLYLGGVNLSGTKTPIVLTQAMNVNDSIIYNPGYLLGQQSLGFFPGADSLEVCVVVWGQGIEAVDLSPPVSYPMDTNPGNNMTCMTYSPLTQSDFSIRYLNYNNGEVSNQDTIKTTFVIKNQGPATFNTGDTIYVSARINGMYMGLNLLGNKTPVVLTQSLGVNDSIIHNPGYLVGSQTLPFFPSATSLSVCVIVWGHGIAAVNLSPAWPGDTNPANNTTCMTFDPSATVGLSSLNKSDVAYTLFPNPASSTLNVATTDNKPFTLVITDVSGREITQAKMDKDNHFMEIGHLAAGLYLYEIHSGATVVKTGKLVKH